MLAVLPPARQPIVHTPRTPALWHLLRLLSLPPPPPLTLTLVSACPQIAYQKALAATFLEGIIFFLICITGLSAIILRWVGGQLRTGAGPGGRGARDALCRAPPPLAPMLR
jgi:hypothetical protein